MLHVPLHYKSFDPIEFEELWKSSKPVLVEWPEDSPVNSGDVIIACENDGFRSVGFVVDKRGVASLLLKRSCFNGH